MRQDRKNLLGPLGLACFLISVTTFGCGSYDYNSCCFGWLEYPVSPIETYYHPGLIFDLTEQERRRGQRVASSEQFGRSQWPVIRREYDNISSRYVDTYLIYTYDDQHITSDSRPRQRYRYRTRTLRSGIIIR